MRHNCDKFNPLEKWEWIYLDGEQTKYQVSNTGKIRNTMRNNRVLAFVIDRYGYPQVCLSHHAKHHVLSVHRLVALAFIPNPTNLPQVNHIDGVKTNNNVSNLEWVTAQDNVVHSYSTGLHDNVALGENHGMNVYTEKQIRKVCIMLQECQDTIVEISKKTGVSKATIQDIKSRKYWTHISKDYAIDNYSSKSVRNIDMELQNQIIDLARLGMSVHEIRTTLGLPYDPNQNARISYYVKKYKI